MPVSLLQFYQNKQTQFREYRVILTSLNTAAWPRAIYSHIYKTPHKVTPKDFHQDIELQTFIDMILYLRKQKMEGDLYLWEYNNKKIVANFCQFLSLFGEYFRGHFQESYPGNWQNKRILDLGGYVGDSALFFLNAGASKVIIYEPVQKNIQAMQYNLADYAARTEIFQKAIHAMDGKKVLISQFPPGDLGFGLPGGEYKMECETVSFQSLLSQHAVDVIKMDIEGAEESLLDVCEEDLTKIPYWIIETHRSDIGHKMIKKFEKCGFCKIKDIKINESVSLFHFSLAEMH